MRRRPRTTRLPHPCDQSMPQGPPACVTAALVSGRGLGSECRPHGRLAEIAGQRRDALDCSRPCCRSNEETSALKSLTASSRGNARCKAILLVGPSRTLMLHGANPHAISADGETISGHKERQLDPTPSPSLPIAVGADDQRKRLGVLQLAQFLLGRSSPTRSSSSALRLGHDGRAFRPPQSTVSGLSVSSRIWCQLSSNAFCR